MVGRMTARVAVYGLYVGCGGEVTQAKARHGVVKQERNHGSFEFKDSNVL